MEMILLVCAVITAAASLLVIIKDLRRWVRYLRK
jgi:hypothetical protein